MRILIFGSNRTTSSLSHSDFSNESAVSRGESGGSWRAALALGFFFVSLLAGANHVAVRSASAQTPTTPPADPSQQPGQPQQPGQQPAEPAPPTPPEQTIPLRQFPVQEPGPVAPTPA